MLPTFWGYVVGVVGSQSTMRGIDILAVYFVNPNECRTDFKICNFSDFVEKSVPIYIHEFAEFVYVCSYNLYVHLRWTYVPSIQLETASRENIKTWV